MEDRKLIIAARGLLGWNQKDLAGYCGLRSGTVGKIERGSGVPRMATVQAIKDTLERAGIDFLEDGVRLRSTYEVVIAGEGWFLRLLEDVYNTLAGQEGAELLVDMADDLKSPPAVVEQYRKLRGEGIAMRQTIEAGNTYLLGPVSEYRWVPRDKFLNWVTLIYGDKFAYSLDGETKCRVVRDPDLANKYRNNFNLVWGLLDQPTKSTAHEEERF